MSKIKVENVEISVIKVGGEDYISLTDMVREVENGSALIEKRKRPMKHANIVKSIFAAAAVLSAVGAWAATEKVGDYTWTYDDIGGDAVEVLGVSPATGDVTVPAVLGGKSVTSIGYGAFNGYNSLAGVTIPDSVTYIAPYAFEYCSGLKSVTIGNGVTSIDSYAFDGCSGLASVMITGGVTNIEDHAFMDCTGLEDVTIPRSVTTIGNYAFKGCTSLVSAVLPASFKTAANIDKIFQDCPVYSKDKVKYRDVNVEVVDGIVWAYTLNGGKASVGGGANDMAIPASTSGDIAIPSTLGGCPVTAIGVYAFCVCDGLTSVTIPNGVTSIEEAAFTCCRGLTSMTLPDGVTSIGEGAFCYCSGLTSVTMPSSITSIGNCAFQTCDGLTSVTIPSSVTSIGFNAFYDCTAMTDMYCHADPAALTWGDASGDFKSGKATKIHVKATQLSDYEAKFGSTVNATFVGDLSDGGEGGGGSGGGDSPDSPDVPCCVLLNAGDITAPYAASRARKLQGAVYDSCDVVGIVELKLGKVNKNGTSKVSGTMTTLDGKKITLKAVSLTGIAGNAPVAVSLDVKGVGKMNVTIGGEQFAGSLGGWHVQSATVGGSWAGRGATVTVDAVDLSMFAGRVLSGLLPQDEKATAAGGKWKFEKAAGVKWAKPKKGAALPEIYDEASDKGLVIDTAKGKTNLSGLKLAYTPKKGTFKGSFKVYALEGEGKATKLKKYTVNVTGVVVDGVGHGTAKCKKPAASWSVTVR